MVAERARRKAEVREHQPECAGARGEKGVATVRRCVGALRMLLLAMRRRRKVRVAGL